MIVSAMSSFKRKRIEAWCDEVAECLNNGTICRSVIGHIPETGTNGNSKPLAGENGDYIENTGRKSTESLLTINNSLNHGTNKIDPVLRNSGHGADSLSKKRENITGTFPFVKLTYSHFHDQRRKIDRLVQGLPILNSNSMSTIDRPSSMGSTEEHAPIIYVNGEEPIRPPNNRSRSSSHPRRHPHNHSHVHFISGPNNNIQQLNAPHTARQLGGHYRSPSGQSRTGVYDPRLRRGNSGAARLYDVKQPQSPEVTVTVDAGLGMTTTERMDRVKTAPAPNRNVTRARQRILTRRNNNSNNNRVIEHTSQIPLQSCWAMAELTW